MRRNQILITNLFLYKFSEYISLRLQLVKLFREISGKLQVKIFTRISKKRTKCFVSLTIDSNIFLENTCIYSNCTINTTYLSSSRKKTYLKLENRIILVRKIQHILCWIYILIIYILLWIIFNNQSKKLIALHQLETSNCSPSLISTQLNGIFENNVP